MSLWSISFGVPDTTIPTLNQYVSNAVLLGRIYSSIFTKFLSRFYHYVLTSGMGGGSTVVISSEYRNL